MNKPVLLILLFLLSVTPIVNAQLYSLSKDEVDLAGYEHVQVIGQDENGIFLLQSNLSLFSERDRVGFKNRKFKIAYYDKNLVYKWFMEIRPRERSYDVEKLVFVDGSVLVFYSKQDRQNNSVNFKMERIDGTGKSYDFNDRGVDISVHPEYYIENIDIVLSKDNSKICFAMACTNERTGTFAISFGVTDREFTSVKESGVSSSFDVKSYDVYQNVVSNTGDFAHLGLVTESSEENRKVLIEHYEIVTCQSNDPHSKMSRLYLPNKQITDCYLSFDEKNKKLVASGFYFDKSSFLASGIFMNTIDPDSSDLNSEIPSAPLSEHLQVKLVSDREKDFGRGLSNYTIQKLIMRNDGGAVILAESSYINQYSYYDYFTQTFNNRTEYHFDNVVVISVNKDGSIDWNKILKKNQESKDDMGVFSSYCHMIRQQEIVMFYNSNFYKNNEVMGEAITNDGTQYQVKIARAMDHITLLPRAGKQIAANEVVIPCLQKRKLMLLKISL